MALAPQGVIKYHLGVILSHSQAAGRPASNSAGLSGTVASPPRSFSVRAYLLLLAAATLAPLLALAALLTWRAVQAERVRTEHAVAATAAGVLTALNREIRGLVETLQALERSPSLTLGDLAAFHQQISELGRIQNIVISLRDTGGRVLASSLTPLGPPQAGLSRVPPEFSAKALSEGRAVVSGVYEGALSGVPVFAVIMPVQRDGAVRYLLHLAPPATRLGDILASLVADPAFRIAIVDASGLILARSHRHDELVGRPTGLGAAVIPPGGTGPRTGRATDSEGRPVYFHALPTPHGWTVVTSVLTDRIDGPWRLAVIHAALIGLLLTGAALFAAWLLGTRLSEAIRGLAAAGSALDRGGPVPVRPSGIREIDEVAAALAVAAERLRLATAQREQAMDRQRLILHELNHRVKNTLAMVQALARLAARDAPDVATYRDRLTERLHGLARTQALLTDSNWSGAGLEELLRSELGLYEVGQAADAPRRIEIGGPPLRFPAHHVVAFGMLAHELGTNAAKYGALSVPQGRLRVSWTVAEERPDRRWLELVWEESGGPAVQPPARLGFGSQMIERGLARQLGATVESEWRPEGLRFRLRMPLMPEAADPPG